MPIRFQCPHCAKTLEVPDDFAGESGDCPGCGGDIVVPAASAAPPAAPAAPVPPAAPAPPAAEPAEPAPASRPARASSRRRRPKALADTRSRGPGVTKVPRRAAPKRRKSERKPKASAAPPPAPAPGGALTCPRCKRTFAKGVVVCMDCGVDLRTGKEIGLKVEGASSFDVNRFVGVAVKLAVAAAVLVGGWIGYQRYTSAHLRRDLAGALGDWRFRVEDLEERARSARGLPKAPEGKLYTIVSLRLDPAGGASGLALDTARIALEPRGGGARVYPTGLKGEVRVGGEGIGEALFDSIEETLPAGMEISPDDLAPGLMRADLAKLRDVSVRLTGTQFGMTGSLRSARTLHLDARGDVPRVSLALVYALPETRAAAGYELAYAEGAAAPESLAGRFDAGAWKASLGGFGMVKVRRAGALEAPSDRTYLLARVIFTAPEGSVGETLKLDSAALRLAGPGLEPTPPVAVIGPPEGPDIGPLLSQLGPADQTGQNEVKLSSQTNAGSASATFLGLFYVRRVVQRIGHVTYSVTRRKQKPADVALTVAFELPSDAQPADFAAGLSYRPGE